MTTRLISAGVGIVITLIVLFLHGTIVFPIVVGILGLIMQLEFLRANRLFKYRAASGASLVFSLLYPIFSVDVVHNFQPLLVVICLTVVFFEYILRKTSLYMRSFFAIMTGMLVIPLSLSTLVRLNHGNETFGIIYVLLVLTGAWIADSGAYFVGSALGKHKLCPAVSPKKTIEGLVGGIAADVLFFIVFVLIYAAIMAKKGIIVTYSMPAMVVLGALCALAGTVGDLTASVLKRQLEIKDYGTIMPGHGGLLDRFDSVLLVAPLVYAFVTAFGIFGISANVPV